MKFFKPEDFQNFVDENSDYAEHCAEAANEKLENKAIKVKGFVNRPQFNYHEFSTGYTNTTHKALLINIEPLEKCNHEVNKLSMVRLDGDKPRSFVCQCGKTVKPTGFEEI